jgi:predicted RNase H-like nuclease
VTARVALVLGVDGCRGGWVGVLTRTSVVAVHAAPTVAELVARVSAEHGAPSVVGVDIPIGLPDHGRRAADTLAAAALGRRRSSLFLTPIRAALQAHDLAAANAISRTVTGQGVSAQAFALRAKVLQVDGWVRTTRTRVVEVHPELSFTVLNGAPLAANKRTPQGRTRRLELLQQVSLDLSGWATGRPRGVAVDDLLDAGAAAWSAARVATGLAHCRPDPPEQFSDAWPAAIWT